MVASDDLFNLVHALTRQEKIYFKVQNGIVAGSQYDHALLFDALEKQRRYDEDSLKKKFARHAFIKRFPAVKNYLWNKILESLVQFYSDKNETGVLHSLIGKASMLQQKGFHRQAARLLRKGYEQALKTDSFLEALEIIALEKRMVRSTLPAGQLEEAVHEITIREHEILRLYRQLSDYLVLENRYYDRRRQFLFPRNEAERNWFRKMLQHPLLRRKPANSSQRALYYFYRLRGQCFFLTGQLHKSYTERRNKVTWLLTQELLTREMVMNYSSSLYDLAVAQRDVGLYADALVSAGMIRQIENIYPRHFRTDIALSVLFKRAITIETDLCVFTGNSAAGLRYCREAENGLKRFGRYIDKDLELIIQYNLALLYLLNGNLKAAQQWLNRILNDHKHDYIQDVVAFAQLIHVFLQLEKTMQPGSTHNEDLVHNRLQAVQRYLQKRKRLYRTEKLMLQFFAQWLKTNGKAERKKLLIYTRKTHEQLALEPLEKPALEFFDFSSWLTSKIEGRSFAAVVAEKSKGYAQQWKNKL